jgi:hypothetical protein
MAIVVALAAVVVWGYVERGYYLAWAREAQLERSLLELAADRDAEAAVSGRKAAVGLPFAPRGGFMPYGPIPIGEHAPRSWEEEMRFSADQASLLRASAERYARKKREIARRWWWLPG